MDAFESIVAKILEHKGYWVRQSYRVHLTKTQKRKIEKPSAPGWELDLVAYRGKANELLVVECKSYLFSKGTRFRAFVDENVSGFQRYKLFNFPPIRRVVLKRLVQQLVREGACQEKPKVKLCLVAGHVATDDDRSKIRQLFDRKGWEFWETSWILEELSKFPARGYQNDIASIIAKLMENQSKDG